MDKFWENYIKTRPADSKGAFDAFAAAHRDPGPRNMYAGGQLVQNTADGSRPGYQGKETKHLPPKIKKQFENVTKEVKKLVNKANAGEKHVRILDITKEIEKKFKIKVSGGRLDIRAYPSLLNLDSRADKIDKVLKNMLIDDKPLKSHWYDAIQNRTGISQDTIGDYLKKSQTYNVIKDEGANYLKYLSGKELGVDLKNMSFSDQLKYASEMQAGMPTYTDMGGNKRYSAKPRNKAMEFALRNWNQNKGEGPIKFFNKNGKPISWEFGKKLPYSDVSFTYNGKKHNFKLLGDINYLKKNFSELYEKQTSVNKLAIKEVDNPFKKGSKITVKDLIKKIQVDGYKWSPRLTTLDIMHGKKGVAGEPFTNLTYASRDLNQLESGINSSLRAGNITKTQANDAIKFIRKDIQGLTGEALDTAIIKRQIDLTKDIKSGKITSYEDMKNLVLKKIGNKVTNKEAGFIATDMLEDFGKMGFKGLKLLNWLQLEYDVAFESLIYDYHRRYAGHEPGLAREALFLPKILAKYFPDLSKLPFVGGLFEPYEAGILEGPAEVLEKRLYERKDDEGKVIGENKLIKSYIDNNKRMEEISSKYRSLEFKKDAPESGRWSMKEDVAHPRLDPIAKIENQQAILADEYKKLEQLNKPDALTGYHTAYTTALEKQDTEYGVKATEAHKKRLGVVDIPWDIVNPNEMLNYNQNVEKRLERAQERFESEQADKRRKAIEDKYPTLTKSQIDKMLEASGYVIDPNIAKYKKDLEFLTKEDILTKYQPAFPPGVKTKPVSTYDMIKGLLSDEDKLAYFADNFRVEKAGGGMAGIRRPSALPPTGGPMSQGIMGTRTGFKNGSKKKDPWYLWPYKRAQEWDKIIESAKKRLFSSDENDSNQ